MFDPLISGNGTDQAAEWVLDGVGEHIPFLPAEQDVSIDCGLFGYGFCMSVGEDMPVKTSDAPFTGRPVELGCEGLPPFG